VLAKESSQPIPNTFQFRAKLKKNSFQFRAKLGKNSFGTQNSEAISGICHQRL